MLVISSTAVLLSFWIISKSNPYTYPRPWFLYNKFSDFISEQVTEKPYKLLILVAQTQDDQNKTGIILEKEAKKLGIEVYQFEVNDGYIRTNEKGNLVFHNYI